MNYSGLSRVVNMSFSLNIRIWLHYITFMVKCQYTRINSEPLQHRYYNEYKIMDPMR